MTFFPWLTLHLIGLTVRLEGERLMVGPAEDLTDDVRAFILANRADLVAAATRLAAATADLAAHNAAVKARATNITATGRATPPKAVKKTQREEAPTAGLFQ